MRERPPRRPRVPALGPTPPRLPRRAVHTPARRSRPLGDPRRAAPPRGRCSASAERVTASPLKAASAAPRRRRRRRRRRSPRPAALRPACAAPAAPLPTPRRGLAAAAGHQPPQAPPPTRTTSQRAPRGLLSAPRHQRAADLARAGAPGRARHCAVASAARAAPEPSTGAQSARKPGAEPERRDADHLLPERRGLRRAGRRVSGPQAGHKAAGPGARRAREERGHPPRRPGTRLDSPENAPEDAGAPEPRGFQLASANGGALE